MSTESGAPGEADQPAGVSGRSVTSRNLLRAGGIVAAMTGLSRISGFFRDVLLSYLFGASALADAFFVAFKIPNFFRRLFAEGAFSQAFVPVLARYVARDRGGELAPLRAFVSRVFGNLALVLLLVTVLGWFGAAGLVSVFAPGFLGEPARFAVTVDLLQIVLPYLMLISLVALASAVLNAHDRFALPAATPVLLNLCMISGVGYSLLFLGGEPQAGVFAVAWAVLAAGFVQLLVQLPALFRLRLLPPPRLSVSHPGVREVGRLLPAAVFAASVAQINTLVDTVLASTLQVGSISWLYYADRLLELPVGLVAVTLGTILLPNLSMLSAAGDRKRFRATLDWGLQVALLLAVPAAIALYLLALPLTATVFRYGAQTAFDVQMAALALRALAAGLVGWVLIKVLAPGYFAHKDTRSPFRFGVAAVVLNIVGNLLLYRILGHVGLALATAASGWLNAVLLWRGLHRDGHYQAAPAVAWTLLRVLLAGAVMGLVLWAIPVERAIWLSGTAMERFRFLSLLVTVGIGTYAGVLLLLGVRPGLFRYQLH